MVPAHRQVTLQWARWYGLEALDWLAAGLALPTGRLRIRLRAETLGYAAYRMLRLHGTLVGHAGGPLALGLRLGWHLQWFARYGRRVRPMLQILLQMPRTRPLSLYATFQHTMRWCVGGRFQVPDQPVHLYVEGRYQPLFPLEWRWGLTLEPIPQLRLRGGATLHPTRYTAGLTFYLPSLEVHLAYVQHPYLGGTPAFGLAYLW